MSLLIILRFPVSGFRNYGFHILGLFRFRQLHFVFISSYFVEGEKTPNVDKQKNTNSTVRNLQNRK